MIISINIVYVQVRKPLCRHENTLKTFLSQKVTNQQVQTLLNHQLCIHVSDVNIQNGLSYTLKSPSPRVNRFVSLYLGTQTNDFVGDNEEIFILKFFQGFFKQVLVYRL